MVARRGPLVVPCHGVNDHGEGIGWLVLGLDDAVRLEGECWLFVARSWYYVRRCGSTMAGITRRSHARSLSVGLSFLT